LYSGTHTKTAKFSKQKKRGKKLKKKLAMPPEISSDVELKKYWAQRYRLFSKFDDGIMLDRGV
jgi:trimethylguanosine synthase